MCPIGEETRLLLRLHVLQVSHYLLATILDHFILHVLWVAVEVFHCHNLLCQQQHHLPHFVCNRSSLFPYQPLVIYLLACQIGCSCLFHLVCSSCLVIPWLRMNCSLALFHARSMSNLEMLLKSRSFSLYCSS